jgi:hypothetical protein
VPAGTYLANFSLAAGTFIRGDGAKTIITPYDDDEVLMLANAGANNTYIENITLRDISFQANVATLALSEFDHILVLAGTKHVLVDHCEFIGFRGDGIVIAGAYADPDVAGARKNVDVTIRNCFFDGVNKDNRNAISVSGCDGCLIEGNYFTRTTKSTMPGAIDVEPNAYAHYLVRNITIRNNKFYDIGGNIGAIAFALTFESYTVPPCGFIIEGNYIQSCGNGIYFNHVHAAGVAEATRSHDLIIQSNTVRDAATRAFQLLNVKNAIISGNSFIDSVSTPLLGFNTAAYNVLDVSMRDNQFLRCASGGGSGIGIFTGSRITLDKNVFIDCGNGSGGTSNGIDFNTGTSAYVSLINNVVISPNSKTLVSVAKQAGHTFTPATNNEWGNHFTIGTNGFQALTGSKTYDPGSLADGVGETTTVTVTGAALGDYAEASFSLDLAGLQLTAYVSAADTVTVRFQNETGAGPVDLGSGTLRARVRKA